MGVEPLLLGIDLGTGSVKTALVNPAGAVVATGACAYQSGSRETTSSEVDPQTWWAAVLDAVAMGLNDRGANVVSVGLSGQMHGVVLLDANLHPVRPAITWIDDRTGYLAPKFEAVALACGGIALPNPVIPGMAALSLMWLVEKEPRCLDQSIAVVQPKDWLGARLTGVACSDASDASGTLLWDFVTDGWQDELIERIGLPRTLFPVIQSPESARGQLLPGPAHELGLLAGIPVSVGLADTAASLLGNECLRQGQAQLTIGSGGQICATLPEPRPDPTGATHMFRGPLHDQWYSAAAIASAGLALGWVRRLFGLSWSDFYDEAFSEPAKISDPVFHPYVVGERTPYMDERLRADWIGLSARHSRPQLIRAALEGTAFALRDAWDAFNALGHRKPMLCVAGGGSHDPRWRQMLANALETPLYLGDGAGGSSRGAALTAGCAIGWYDSLAQAPTTVSWKAEVEPDGEVIQTVASLARFRATQGAQRLPDKASPRPSS